MNGKNSNSGPLRGAVSDKRPVFTRPAEWEMRLSLEGDWTHGHRPVTEDDIRRELEAGPAVKLLSFDGRQLGSWDSGLLTFLLKVRNFCAERGTGLDVATAEGNEVNLSMHCFSWGQQND